MIVTTPQVILSFEPLASAGDDKTVLRVCHTMREYFDAGRYNIPEYTVHLPRAFQVTAATDKSGWRQYPRKAEPAMDLGRRMWENLPEEVRGRVLAGYAGVPQRVCVLSTSSGMDDIPWEWLSDEQGSPVAVQELIRFMRLVPVLQAQPPLTVTPPLRVLIVLTNPKDERLLNSSVELDVVKQGLDANPEYQVEVLLEPRLEALREQLKSSPHIVHYIGHAGISGGAGNLILHDHRDGSRWLSVGEVASLLPSSVRLLCLSTCVTTRNYQIEGLQKFAHCPAEIPLPTTIVNQYTLEPRQAATFWREFYPALIQYDGDVVEAFHKARVAVHLQEQDTWDWASFSLVVRDGTGNPLRLAPAETQSEERVAAEIQAQWAGRLANNLAARMRSLGAESQKHWEASLADEEARVADLESNIEKY